MRQPRFEIGDGRSDTVGLTWRMNYWDGRQIIGHDGATIGQSAFLRIDPQARVAEPPRTTHAPPVAFK